MLEAEAEEVGQPSATAAAGPRCLRRPLRPVHGAFGTGATNSPPSTSIQLILLLRFQRVSRASVLGLPGTSAASPYRAPAGVGAKEDRDSAWWARRAWSLLSALRARSPLVQCITNLVSMDIAANALLAAGASPAMVHSLREVPDFTPRCDAVYVNVGTLSEDWLPSMRAAASASAGRPWVLDPVAAAASGFRMEACLDLLALRPAVVRGNASEILALAARSAAASSNFKGADSSHDSVDAIEAAKALALSSGAVVAVSGAVDFITDGKRVVGVSNGVPMMQKITATGCAVTAIIAAFVAMEPSDALDAAVCALAIFGLAGEIGMESAKGPASLRMHLIDSLYCLDEETVTSRVRISLRP